MERVLPSLSVLLFQLPVYLTWLAGIVAAIITWKKHAKVSLLTVIALGLSLLHSVVGTFVSVWLPMSLLQRGVPSDRIGMLMGINGMVGTLLNLVVWVLILIAVFGWRKSQETQA